MNYIKEINAFHDRVMTNPLSVGAKVLWYTMMHVNNKARWVKEFSIAESLICGISGLSGSAFRRARVELRDKGFITYQSRGSKAPLYQMVSLVMEDEEVTAEEAAEDGEEVGGERKTEKGGDVAKRGEADKLGQALAQGMSQGEQRGKEADDVSRDADQGLNQKMNEGSHQERGQKLSQVPGQETIQQEKREMLAGFVGAGVAETVDGKASKVADGDVAPLYKRNEDKRKAKAKVKEINISSMEGYTYKFFCKYFGKPHALRLQEYQAWESKMGSELMLQAMTKAVDQEKCTWGYVKGILTNWYRDGLFTMEKVKAAEENYRNNRNRGKRWNYRKQAAVPDEIVPDWFRERKREEEMRG